MSSRSKIPKLIQEQVRQRAKFLCEYCHALEQWQYVSFTVDHVIPLNQGGADNLDNLALACFHCNRQKSNRSTGVDPESSLDVQLFNPRCDRWQEHFIWSVDGLRIIGMTPIGRATVIALAWNRDRVIPIRAADQDVERHPPTGDPMQ